MNKSRIIGLSMLILALFSTNCFASNSELKDYEINEKISIENAEEFEKNIQKNINIDNVKYELQDVLLAKTSHEFFSNACKEANKYHFDRLDDKIIFIIDSIIDALIARPNILKFIQKNLSLGLYSEKLTDLLDSEELGIKELFINEVKEKDIPLEYPEMTLFMIIELVSSTVFTSIVEKQPLPIEEFKPHLYKTIRLLINEKLEK